MTYQSRYPSGTTGEWLIGAVKKNPEGMLLLAAGCALLLRSGGSRSSLRSASQARSTDWSRQDGQGRYQGSGMSDTVSRASDNVRDYASELSRSVGDKASNYAAAVGEYAGEVGRTVADQSERMARQTQATLQQTMNRVLKEQPLAVAVMGLAAGAAVAAVLPSTDIEERALGPVAAKLSGAADAVRDNVAQGASKAGERLMEVADERGLNKDGLKEVAGEVADAFGGAFRGDEQNRAQTSDSGSSTDRQSGPARGFEQGSNEFRSASKPGSGSRS